MHENTLERWQHEHTFVTHNDRGERRTRAVLGLTAVMMVAEITAGTVFGSMALLADGWHMGTHVAAFLILRAAYVHVLADALTSVLAIIALLAGKVFGFIWMDPLMGIVGAIIITRWSFGLLRQTSPILLDGGIDAAEQSAIKTCIENDADNRVADMHVWRVGAHDTAAIISVVTHCPRPAAHYRELLRDFHKLSHITIEVHTCES